ncbi:MAG: signal peptidase II [Elusimicrobiota bacterium]
MIRLITTVYKYLPCILTSLIIVLLDRVTKVLAVSLLKPVEYITILPFLYLSYTENTGAAFGMLQGFRWLFVIAAILVFTILYHELKKTSSVYFQITLGFIFGGAGGNFVDRLFRGVVVDFIDFRVFPVFNVSDIAISIGIGLWIIHLLFLNKAK